MRVARDTALLLAVFFAPITWGKLDVAGQGPVFSLAGQSVTFTLIAIAAAAHLAAMLSWRPRRHVKTPLDQPLIALLAWSLLSALFVSVSRLDSYLDFERLLGAALFFWLVVDSRLYPSRLRAFSWSAMASLALSSLLFILFARSVFPDPAGWNPVLLVLVFVAALAVIAIIGWEAWEEKEEKPTPLGFLLVAGLLCSGLIAVAGFGAVEYVMKRPQDPTWRIFSTFFNPNPLGCFLAMLIPPAVALALVPRRNPGYQVVWLMTGLAGAALLTATLVLTRSKGALVGFFVAGLCFLVLLAAAMKGRHPTGRRLALGLVALWVLAPILLLASGLAPGRFALENLRPKQPSNQFRLLTWRGTWDLALAHPLLGTGPGTFQYVYPRYARAGFTRLAHQNYLELAAETGFPGGVAFLALNLAMLWLGFRAFRGLRGYGERLLVAGAVAGILVPQVHGLLDYGWYIGAIQLSLFLFAGFIAHLAGPSPTPAPEPALWPAGKRRKERQREAEIAVTQSAGDAPGSGLLRAWESKRALSFLGASAVGLMALVVGFGWVGWRSYAGDAKYFAGEEALKRGEFQLAWVRYLEATETDPLRADFFRRLAFAEASTDPEGALAAAKRAVKLQPTEAQNYSTLAAVYSLLGEWEPAEEAYRSAIELNPNYLNALHRLAELYQARGRWEDAYKLYERMAGIETSTYGTLRAISFSVETEYCYAHYWLGVRAYRRMVAGEYRGSDPALREFPAALREYEHVIRILDDYDREGYKVQELLRAIGRATPGIETELLRLRAKTYARLAQLWQLGDESKAAFYREEAGRIFPQIWEEVAAEDRS